MAGQLFRKISDKSPIWLIRHMVNFYPPFLGAGIKVIEARDDYRFLKIQLKRSWYNTNYVGTQFGGSIYAMVDPFYMLMIMNNLGRDYIVWDKAAHIEFKRPGKTDLYASFSIDQELIEEIRDQTKDGDKYVFDLPIEVTDNEGKTIASVTKTLYVRKKK